MQANEYPQRIERQVRIKRMDPLSLAKFSGVLGAVAGLIFGAFAALLSLTGFGLGGRTGMAGMLFGVGAIIALPIFYGIGAFIGGLIQAIVYNVAAGLMGGIEITVE